MLSHELRKLIEAESFDQCVRTYLLAEQEEILVKISRRAIVVRTVAPSRCSSLNLIRGVVVGSCDNLPLCSGLCSHAQGDA